jgi:tRNA(Arg) A34 adenosine deaminase TadA
LIIAPSALSFALPEFLQRANASPVCLSTAASRMRFVLDLVATNVASNGGPFAAAVFERETGRLVAAGVNRVVSTQCSAAHAEVLALSLAQQRLGDFDLGKAALPELELVSSAEPCVMCIGALLWSGVRHLICGARGEDVVAIGFDEGPKHPQWQDELRARGVNITTDVLRAESVALLQAYAHAGGPIYNAGMPLMDGSTVSHNVQPSTQSASSSPFKGEARRGMGAEAAASLSPSPPHPSP